MGLFLEKVKGIALFFSRKSVYPKRAYFWEKAKGIAKGTNFWEAENLASGPKQSNLL